MKGAKIGTLFLISIFALAGLGISYAAWIDYDDIDVAVSTGDFDFQINAITVNEDDDATIYSGWDSTNGWWVTVTGAYPGWKGWITVQHKNFGTVPLKFDSFQVISLTGDDDLKNGYTLKFYPPGEIVGSTNFNIYGTLQAFTVQQYYDDWIGPYEVILQPGATWDSLVSLELGDITEHYNEPVTFTFRQWATQE